jgi:hypothetical protein
VAQDCDGAITALFPEKSLKILSSYIDGALSKTPKGSVFERRVRMMRMEFQYFTMYLEMLKEYNSENKEPGLNLIDRMVSHIKEMTRANPDFVSEKGVIKEIEKHRKYFDENRGFRKDKTVIDIPREWMFKPDPDNIGLEEKWFEKDSIRGDWGSVRIGNAWKNQGYDYKGTAWYKTTFKIPGEKRGRDIFLFVGALDISGDFYVNGKEVFKRKFVNPDDWKTAFEIDLSTCLRHGEENTFAIRVDGGGLGGVWKDMFLYWKNSQ